jgi:hypothetical protein
MRARKFDHHNGRRPVDQEEQEHRDHNVYSQIEPMRQGLVLKEAEQIHVPLIEIGEAIEKDDEESDLVDDEQELAACLVVKVLEQSNQNKISQESEEPFRKITNGGRRPDFLRRPLEQMI